MDPSGQVLDAVGLRGDESLMQAAMHAVLKWRYQPPLLNGSPRSKPDDGDGELHAVRRRQGGYGWRRRRWGGWRSARRAAATRRDGHPAAADSLEAWPQNAIRVGGNIAPPRRTVDVKPVYPADAQANGVQGLVICEAVIGPDGKVYDVRILRSVPMLDQAAIDAVKQWQDTPTLLNGTPVPVIMTVTVSFTLG